MNNAPYNEQTVVPKQPVLEPQSVPRKKVQRRRFGHTKWNLGDRLILGLTIGVALIGMFAIISMSNQGTKADRQLSQVTAELAAVRNDNNDLKQEIGAATTKDELAEVAKKEDLSINNDNVRNVK
ncbi:septum formation initiator family protein [Weissella minor]|uniref:septum formation initiator family protein n=1 Tax=Weissella minor TaxID=1620 RepID=UPI001BB066AD|nr:septum formation initiator family protein [Weissella minor]MBS0949927.1 septum formation initiator family protein [Weissella minor]